MSIESDGKSLRVELKAPSGGASVRLRDGDTVVWEGDLDQGLSLELDLEQWQVPEALRQLLSVSLPDASNYSPSSFKPLATPFISLATLTVEPKTRVARWSERAVLPGQMLPLSVMSGAIHYAQTVFEGSKVFFRRDGDDVEARIFRAGRNASRMWRSGLRMGMPLEGSIAEGVKVDEEGFGTLYRQLVRDAVLANVQANLFDGAFEALDTAAEDFSWHRTPPALYIRPVLFASGPVLGVKPADHYTLAIYVTPVGKYRGDMVLRVERERPRAVKGGTGAVKAACNYAPTLSMMRDLYENRAQASPDRDWTSIFDDILFLGPGGQIEEMGGANFFVLLEEEGRLALLTPPSVQESETYDTILPGITRDTVLRIAGELGLAVRIDAISLARLMEMEPDEARRTAVFTTGTAAGVAPVVALLDGSRSQRFAVWDAIDDAKRCRHLDEDSAPEGSPLSVARKLRSLLFQVHLGDFEGIRRLAPEAADGLRGVVEGEGWIESFTL